MSKTVTRADLVEALAKRANMQRADANHLLTRMLEMMQDALVDGDTVKFNKQLVRLFGIDAPEKGQTCDQGRWSPGPQAKKTLENFIAGRPVNCRQVDFDHRNQRPVAQCFAGDDDLQAMMVSAGWAWAFVRYSDRYVPEERDAKVLKVGVHAHDCVPAWDWRAAQNRQFMRAP